MLAGGVAHVEHPGQQDALVQGALAKRFRQRTLILAGFVVAIAGMLVLLAMASGNPSPWSFAPGLFLMGTGVGIMLTPSVNIVQSAFPENQQGEISGLSRSVSNLGSSLGTAIAGTILVADLGNGHQAYAIAIVVLALMGLIGLAAAIFIPRAEIPAGADTPSTAAEVT